MGQKTNPIGFRVGINRTWDSRWFAGRREYGALWHEDLVDRGIDDHLSLGKHGHRRFLLPPLESLILEPPRHPVQRDPA